MERKYLVTMTAISPLIDEIAITHTRAELSIEAVRERLRKSKDEYLRKLKSGDK